MQEFIDIKDIINLEQLQLCHHFEHGYKLANRKLHKYH
jgi:hypothetical protein